MWAKYTTASNELVKAPTLPIHHHRNLIDNGGIGRQRRVSQSPPHSLLLLLPCSCNWQHIKTDPTCLSLSLSSYSLCVFTLSDVRLPSLLFCQRFFTAVVQLSHFQQLIRSRCRRQRSCLCLCLCRCFCRCPCLATGGLLATQFVTHTFAHTVRDTCIVPLLINVAKSCLLVTIWNFIFVI